MRAGTGAVRDRAPGVEHSVERPDVIRHRSELDAADDADGPSGAEPMSIGAALGRRIGLTRLGIHHERSPARAADLAAACRERGGGVRVRARRHAGYLDRRPPASLATGRRGRLSRRHRHLSHVRERHRHRRAIADRGRDAQAGEPGQISATRGARGWSPRSLDGLARASARPSRRTFKGQAMGRPRVNARRSC